MCGGCVLCEYRPAGVLFTRGYIMGKYRVIEEWTNYRIVEIDADSEDMAVDLVQDGQGDEVDGGTDNRYTHAELVQIDGGK